MPTLHPCSHCGHEVPLPLWWGLPGFTCPRCEKSNRLPAPQPDRTRQRAAPLMRRPHRASSAGTGRVLGWVALATLGAVILLGAVAGRVWLLNREADRAGGSGATAVAPPSAKSSPAPATTKSTTTPGEGWYGAGGSVKIGMVEVAVYDVQLNRVSIWDKVRNAAAQSEDEYLRVRIYIKNQSDEKLVHYRRWQDTFSIHGRLKDDRGNSYKWINPPFGTEFSNSIGAKPIYPKSDAYDVYVFQPPVSAATELQLELDADRVGEPGVYRFRIPATAWKK